MPIELSPEVLGKMTSSLRRYFEENMEEEIGDLKASLLLDFCLKEFGPVVYNRAIADAQAFMGEKVADLDSSCYEPEDGYWRK